MKPTPVIEPTAPENENPGLPGLRTWRGVYVFVLACFALYLVLLALLSRMFS
jgi:hypothetical protein